MSADIPLKTWGGGRISDGLAQAWGACAYHSLAQAITPCSTLSPAIRASKKDAALFSVQVSRITETFHLYPEVASRLSWQLYLGPDSSPVGIVCLSVWVWQLSTLCFLRGWGCIRLLWSAWSWVTGDSQHRGSQCCPIRFPRFSCSRKNKTKHTIIK